MAPWMNGTLLVSSWANPFRDGFEEQGIYGARSPESDAYVRVLSKTIVGQEEGRLLFLNTILSGVLHDGVLQVRLGLGCFLWFF